MDTHIPPRKQYVLRELFRQLGSARKLYAMAIALMVIDAACQSVVPLLFRDVLNGLQQDAAGYMEMSFWWHVGIALLIIAVFIPSALFGHVLAGLAITRLLRNLRTNLYRHIQGMSLDFHARHKVGESTARLNGDIDQTGVTLGTIVGVVWAIIAGIQGLLMMIYVHWQLSILFMFWFVLAAFATMRWMPHIRRVSRKMRDEAGVTSGLITEYMSILTVIKSFTYEGRAADQVSAQAQTLCAAHDRLVWQQSYFNDAMQTVFKFLAPLSLLLVGSFMVAQGTLLIGDLVAFYGYWLLLSHALSLVTNSISQITIGLAAADRICEWLQQEPSVQDQHQPEPLAQVHGHLAFNQVTFAYPQDPRKNTLENCDFTIEAGQTIALVGPSGAGKSTVLQLLLRFYDPHNGVIRLDGRDIGDVSQHDLRRHIGVVFQEPIFLSGTILDNLLLGNPSATSEQIDHCLRQAHAFDFVQSLPDGLHTELGEHGARLSGGQKQRLSIARALIKDPAIMILDEATAALDAESEYMVVQAMNSALKGRTAIIIAHRIATIRNADKILVIENGRVLAQGAHQQLRHENTLYARYCEQQCVA